LPCLINFELKKMYLVGFYPFTKLLTNRFEVDFAYKRRRRLTKVTFIR